MSSASSPNGLSTADLHASLGKQVGEEWGDAVDGITRPGVVFWGADDPYVTPEFGERLAQRTGARLVMFPDSGHWWPATKAAEVAGELEALWSSV